MKRWIHASTSNWPDSDFWYGTDLYEDEDVWFRYLQDPETKVIDELKIFPEASVQAGHGAMVIYDESGEDRFDTVWVDFNDYCDKEIEMAANSSNADEYAQKYRTYMKELCGMY